MSSPLTADDFPAIEDAMRKIISADQPFVREELPLAEALARIDGMGEPYKREYAEELAKRQDGKTLTFYKNGPFLDGRLEDALEFAARALTFARERGQRPYEAWALWFLGEIAARRDPPEQADGHYRDALALAEDLGMRPLVAHCHLGLGKLSRRAGTVQQAREHLTTAITMYREMDMRLWLEQSEAEMGGRA